MLKYALLPYSTLTSVATFVATFVIGDRKIVGVQNSLLCILFTDMTFMIILRAGQGSSLDGHKHELESEMIVF